LQAVYAVTSLDTFSADTVGAGVTVVLLIEHGGWSGRLVGQDDGVTIIKNMDCARFENLRETDV